jgi:hypothetical protein
LALNGLGFQVSPARFRLSNLQAELYMNVGGLSTDVSLLLSAGFMIFLSLFVEYQEKTADMPDKRRKNIQHTMRSKYQRQFNYLNPEIPKHCLNN